MSVEPTPQGLAAAAEATESAKTGRIEGEVTMVVGGDFAALEGMGTSDEAPASAEDLTVELAFTGSYDLDAGRSAMTATVVEVSGEGWSGSSSDEEINAGDTIETVTDGATVYTRETVGGTVQEVDGKEWVSESVGATGDDLAFLGMSESGASIDPATLLDQLRSVSDVVTDEGEVDIDGVTTRHYHAEVSVADLAAEGEAETDDSMPEELFGDFDPEAMFGDMTIPVDVYVGPDGTVRRVFVRWVQPVPSTATSVLSHPPAERFW